MDRRAGREPGVELPNSATDVGLAIAVVVACPHDAPIRPALPRLALPIILVPLISGLRLRSSIAATGRRQMHRHQLQSELCGYSGPAVNGGGHNASWRVDRRMGSLGFHRCQRNACYDRRCDCIPVPCSSEDMDFSSDRDRGGNDGDRRLRGSGALTDHLTEVTRPAMSSSPPFKTIALLN